jgi:hypothetical protein
LNFEQITRIKTKICSCICANFGFSLCNLLNKCPLNTLQWFSQQILTMSTFLCDMTTLKTKTKFTNFTRTRSTFYPKLNLAKKIYFEMRKNWIKGALNKRSWKLLTTQNLFFIVTLSILPDHVFSFLLYLSIILPHRSLLHIIYWVRIKWHQCVNLSNMTPSIILYQIIVLQNLPLDLKLLSYWSCL